MTEKDIKPIPEYMLKRIKKHDSKQMHYCKGHTRYYAYLTKIDGELGKITVACKEYKNEWYCKQVAVHSIHSDVCLSKDTNYYYIGGYVTSWYEEGLSYKKYWETGEWEFFVPENMNTAPVINPEYALKFKEYRYSAVNKFGRWNVFKYLRLYEQYPQAEMLVKFDLGYLALSKQILKKVGSDKRFRKWLANKRKELSTNYYYVETIMQAYKTGRPLDETQNFLKRKRAFDHDKYLKPLRELFKGKDLERFFNYLDEQNTSYRTYMDYLTACKFLRLDMSEDKNRFPHDFRRWHDIRIDEYHTAKAEADEKERAALYEKFATVADKYLPLQKDRKDAFIVIIARSPKDLIREGDILHHCVGRMGYDQKFVREETLIFFVRNAEKPDTPFVTLEYSLSQKKVLQCYGDKDSRPNDNVMEFVNKNWLPFANRQLNKINKTAKAA